MSGDARGLQTRSEAPRGVFGRFNSYPFPPVNSPSNLPANISSSCHQTFPLAAIQHFIQLPITILVYQFTVKGSEKDFQIKNVKGLERAVGEEYEICC